MLHKELARAMDDPEMRERLDQLGVPAYILTPPKTIEFVVAAYNRSPRRATLGTQPSRT